MDVNFFLSFGKAKSDAETGQTVTKKGNGFC